MHSYRCHSPRLFRRCHAIRGDGDGDTRFPIDRLHAHHLSAAVEANGVVRVQVGEDQGTLDRITGGKRLLRHKEDPAGTDVTGDAGPTIPFYKELDPMAWRATPVWFSPIHRALDLRSAPALEGLGRG